MNTQAIYPDFTFPKLSLHREDIYMTNKHIRCWTTSVIRGIEIKITMNYHFISMRMARIKKKIDNKYWENI